MGGSCERSTLHVFYKKKIKNKEKSAAEFCLYGIMGGCHLGLGQRAMPQGRYHILVSGTRHKFVAANLQTQLNPSLPICLIYDGINEPIDYPFTAGK